MSTLARARVVPAVPGTAILVELFKYGLGSTLALTVDCSLLIFLTEHIGLHYLTSATVSFLCGMIVAYSLSICIVFQHRSVSTRSTEFLGFVAIGLAGLVLNQVLIWMIVTYSHFDYAAAKVPTAGAVFAFNFALRRSLLFSRR